MSVIFQGVAPAESTVIAFFGCLLHKPPEDIAGRGVDDRREQVGAMWQARHFQAYAALALIANFTL